MTDIVAEPVVPLENGSTASAAGGVATFPDLLRSHRERAGLTQRALADLSTISPRAIRDLEAGRANARTQTIRLLADALRLRGLAREVFVQAGLGGRRGSTDGIAAPTLPQPVNALVGRDAEVRVLADVLESGRRRVISISGLPGVGKTRVAVEIAARLSSRRGWPVLWLDRRPRPDSRVGAAFGPLLQALRSLVDSELEDVTRVCQLVGQHEALLVLDGFADLKVPFAVEELLAYCPGVRVISTSRAPWYVTGVQPTVVPPLPTPAAGLASLDAVAAVPSVRLLVERLTEVRPHFTLTAADAEAAGEICRRVDGLPLALEAVARRFGVLSLRQITDAPTRDLLDFTVPAHPGDEPATIGSLIASGVQRLTGEQGAILRELARHEQSWTVPELATTRGRTLDEVVDDLSVLIGHGMVSVVHGDTSTVLHLPNLLRVLLTP